MQINEHEIIIVELSKLQSYYSQQIAKLDFNVDNFYFILFLMNKQIAVLIYLYKSIVLLRFSNHEIYGKQSNDSFVLYFADNAVLVNIHLQWI